MFGDVSHNEKRFSMFFCRCRLSVNYFLCTIRIVQTSICKGKNITRLLFYSMKFIYTALVADSEEKLCRLVSEFGIVCERRKLRVNIGKSKVMRCLRNGNGGRMHVILNGIPLEAVDSLCTWGRKWQLMEGVKVMWYTE